MLLYRFNLTDKEGSADRKVPIQPLVFHSKDGKVSRYNLRKVLHVTNTHGFQLLFLSLKTGCHESKHIHREVRKMLENGWSAVDIKSASCDKGKLESSSLFSGARTFNRLRKLNLPFGVLYVWKIYYFCYCILLPHKITVSNEKTTKVVMMAKRNM